MEYKQFFSIKVIVLATVACVIIFMSFLFIKIDRQRLNVQQTQLEQQNEVVTDAPVTELPIHEDAELLSKHYIISEDTRSLQSTDSVKALSSCYDNTRSSVFYYTGVPQVDNCIAILAGNLAPELIEDYDDYLGTELVHNYIVGINGSVYNIIYIPDSEAIALPLMVNVTEYLNGTPYRIVDNSRGYDD